MMNRRHFRVAIIIISYAARRNTHFCARVRNKIASLAVGHRVESNGFVATLAAAAANAPVDSLL